MLVVAALYFGREILVPLALGTLFAFVLTPPIAWLRRRGIPRVFAIALVVSLALGGVVGLVTAVGAQLVQLAENLPRYHRNIQTKLASLSDAAPGGGMIESVAGTLKNLQREVAPAKPKNGAENQSPATVQRPEPLPVTIEPAPMQPLEILQAVVNPIIGPLGTAALVVLFLVFILIEREELRDRFIKLVSGGDLQRSTEAITEAGARVTRYLVMQLLVNVSYGIPIGIGLAVIGVPNAALWGVLAAVLRFIPYLGPWIAALFPIAIAIGVDPGWSMLLWTIALFLVIELVSNNVLEPWLYGSSTGLSSFAIIVAAIFWTVLWGPVGLLLATPLTVCLVVIGRFVPQLEWLGVLLGSDPVLSPAERFYQRLLADDIDEAVRLAEEHVKEDGSLAFYDDVAVAALRLAENDRQRSLDVSFRRAVSDNLIAVGREVEQLTLDASRKRKTDGTPFVDREPGPARVLCIAGRTEIDLAAAEMLAARLGELAIEASTLPALALTNEGVNRLEFDNIRAVCLSYFHPAPRARARGVFRQIEQRRSGLVKIVCCWNVLEPASARELEAQIGVGVALVTTIAAAEEKVLAAMSAPTPSTASTVIDREVAMIGMLHSSGLAAGSGTEYTRLSALLEQSLGIASVIVAPANERAVKSTADPSAAIKTDQRTRLRGLVVAEVAKAGGTIVVPNVAEDTRFANDAELLEKGARFLAATPMRTRGNMIGALAVLGVEARDLDAEAQRKLETIAAEVVTRLQSAITVDS